MQRTARVEDDDRLAGLWLRPSSGELIFYAPAILPYGRPALCQVELRYDEQRRRVTHWALYRRGAPTVEGQMAPVAVAAWQALAAVERALEQHGVRFAGGAGQWQLPTD